MKVLKTNQYFEKLKINPMSLDEFDNVKIYQYQYEPKTKKQLIKIIDKLVKQNGFECDLNVIDTSNITDMSYLFDNFLDKCELCVDVSNWNVSNVIYTEYMFRGCKKFNSDVSSWDVSKVTNMQDMFTACETFNQNLNEWDVSNVINMEGVFSACYAFNQPLNKWADKISQVKNMRRMFYNCHSFDQDLSNWVINRKYTDVYNMFIFDKHHPHGYHNVISRSHYPTFK